VRGLRRLVLLVCALTLVAACSDPEPSAPPSVDEASAALEGLAPPEDGEFDGGEFDVSKSILRGQLAADGHLSSASWDVYVVLDDGQIGAWGAGMDVWDSTAAAREAAEREAGFFSCEGPREPVTDLDDDPDDFVVATSCKKPGNDGYRATASAADGFVTRNLTVAAATRELTVAGLLAVWESLSATSDQLVADLE
jgi:hypothetical protein